MFLIGSSFTSDWLFAQTVPTDDYLLKQQQSTKPIRAAGEDNLGWNFYFPEELEEELTRSLF